MTSLRSIQFNSAAPLLSSDSSLQVEEVGVVLRAARQSGRDPGGEGDGGVPVSNPRGSKCVGTNIYNNLYTIYTL